MCSVNDNLCALFLLIVLCTGALKNKYCYELHSYKVVVDLESIFAVVNANTTKLFKKKIV